jgi:putative membrane protein
MKRLLPLLCAGLSVTAVVAVPTAGAESSASDKSVSAADAQYLETSIQGDLFEIAGGNLAERKSHNAAVRRLAKQLVSTHSTSLSDAVKLAHKLGIAAPASATPTETWELKVLGAMGGTTFNRWYSSLEVYDHIQDIQETTDEVNDGTNPAIRSEARTELPMLKMHLRMARAAFAATGM